MKIFLDTADIDDIRVAARWGVLDGVTTNPTLFSKVGGSYDDIPRLVALDVARTEDDRHAPASGQLGQSV